MGLVVIYCYFLLILFEVVKMENVGPRPIDELFKRRNLGRPTKFDCSSIQKLTFIRTLLDTDFDRTFHEPNPLRLVRLMKSSKFGVGLTG